MADAFVDGRPRFAGDIETPVDSFFECGFPSRFGSRSWDKRITQYTGGFGELSSLEVCVL